MNRKPAKGAGKGHSRWQLALFDLAAYLFACILILVIYPSHIDRLDAAGVVCYSVLGVLCVVLPRILLSIYRRIWRYATASDYLMLVVADTLGCVVFLLARNIAPWKLTLMRAFSLIALDLLAVICMRLVYQYIYLQRNRGTRLEKALLKMVYLLTRNRFEADESASDNRRIRIAIVGAGSIGVMLAEELLRNQKAGYEPVCFIDTSIEKVGRLISGIPVVEREFVDVELKRYGVQEIVFAVPSIKEERRKQLYEFYKNLGYKIKTYDYPVLGTSGKRKSMRDFAIEDLLYRNSVDSLDERTAMWYRKKVVMVTGGGGSIGSELARQIAKARPSRLVLLDIYENGVYDVQQELRMAYGESLQLSVEIANICDHEQMESIIRKYRPDIVLHAAAHKHVPLMESNVCEAVRNNVFGTLNVVEACERNHVKRFIMISTDKAVNPTNVMGATKRMCEIIVLSRKGDRTSFSATRFGNVLGSNGSVIPLFKRQIENGGPITITDKRIIRYFMTIPEAAQLVLTSGVMADNGELFVLDMGKPIKILNLAEDMIRLSGLEPYKDIDIVEVGLRPGEKLYEELLIHSETLEKTDNDMIFVERNEDAVYEEVIDKIVSLKAALNTGNDEAVYHALKRAVPTFKTPEEVNAKVEVA